MKKNQFIRLLSLSALALGSLSSAACSFYARSPEDYSSETQKLIEAKRESIESCYTEILKKDQKAEGIVAVNFTVAKKTGEITDPAINKKRTTAPESVGMCVIDAMKGLKLDPPDQREGVASFELEFKAKG